MSMEENAGFNAESLISAILDTAKREYAISELSKQRETIPDLSLMIWKTPGVVPAMLFELVSVYQAVNNQSLTSSASTKVCNILALFQCIASHESTRNEFIAANLPLYLYPFLNTTSKTKPFEYLRLTSLGVIGALVKNDSSQIIDFLLSTEIVPLCLKIMETGNELSRTVFFILTTIGFNLYSPENSSRRIGNEIYMPIKRTVGGCSSCVE
jgi:CCR4-NOT transcription complex subunit 9